MRTMLMKVNGEDVELGPCETRGAMHHVQLTADGRTAYLANTPDTILVVLHGEELQVRASFIRNSDWKIIGDGPGRIARTTPKRKPAPAPVDTDADADEAPEPDMTPKTYAQMTKPELKAQCELAGVSKTGSRADLIERLEAQADANESVE